MLAENFLQYWNVMKLEIVKILMLVKPTSKLKQNPKNGSFFIECTGVWSVCLEIWYEVENSKKKFQEQGAGWWKTGVMASSSSGELLLPPLL